MWKQPEMLGVQATIGLAKTHYAIFSSEEGAWGRGRISEGGRLVVFLHGLGAQVDQLTWGVEGGLARALVDAGYTLLAMDLYGHGYTEAPESSLAPHEFVQQLQALLLHLKVTQPFDLIGFSHGCFIASAYAAESPAMVEHLVLMSPFGCDIPGHSWRVVAGFGALIVHLFFDGNMSRFRTIYRILLHLEGYKLDSFLKIIGVASTKVLIQAGSWDRDPAMGILQTAQRIHKALPRSILQIVPRGTHNTWSTGPADKQRSLRTSLIKFLSDTMDSDETSRLLGKSN